MKSRVFISLLLTAVMLMSACGSSGDAGTSSTTAATTVDSAPVTDGFETVFRFVVASDTHISSPNDASADHFAKLFTSSYAYAESQEYNTVDAVVVVGDLTETGTSFEYSAFNEVLEENIREDTVFIPVTGNHDVQSGGMDRFIELYEKTDIHTVVNGYHFIGISHVQGDGYANSLDWLSAELKAAAEDDPDKPIITFQHHHIKDTVYTSNERYAKDSEALDAIYSEYSQVLNFSGHSHAPINNPASVYQSDYTMFGTGTLYYLALGNGMTYGITPPGTRPVGQFYIVEVSKDNSVRVLPYNVLTGDFFKTADGKEQLIYRVDDLKDTSTWLYTDAKTDASAAPVFAEDAEITVKTVNSTTAQLSVPQASDDDCIYSYKIICTPESGEPIEHNYFSEYYSEPVPENLSFMLGGLAPATEYTVEVTPVDAYGKVGEPITGSLVTTDGNYTYTPGSNVNFVGTFNSFDSVESMTLSTSNPAYGKAADGDVFIGKLHSAAADTGATCEIVSGGWNGTSALAFSSSVKDEMEAHIFATDSNGSATAFEDADYLRVWVDFTGVDFYYASFGLIAPTGSIYTSNSNLDAAGGEFMYLADGSDEWITLNYGDYGAFGQKQKCSVQDLKGWLAFPVEDLTLYRDSNNGLDSSKVAYPYSEVMGIYMYWDYSARTKAGTNIIIDEVGLVGDYTVFDEYNG